MISATTEKEIELFIADVKKQLYIPDIARHYVSVIYDLILEYDHKPSSAPEGTPPEQTETDAESIRILLYLVILNQMAFSFGDICIRLTDRENGEMSAVQRAVAKIYELSVLNSYSYQKQFVRYQLDSVTGGTGSAEDVAEVIKQCFDSFWSFLLDYDSRHCAADYVDVLRRFPLMAELLDSSYNGTGKDSYPLICYPCDESEPCVYFGKNFYYETMASRLIGEKINYGCEPCGRVNSFYSTLADSGQPVPPFNQLVRLFLDCIFIQQVKSFDVSGFIAGAGQSGEWLYPVQSAEIERKLAEVRNNPDFVIWSKVAAATACLSDFTVITGGPGTGKTTTVTKILLLMYALAYVQQQDETERFNVCLAAPTGKAANRMKESIKNSLSGAEITAVKENLADLLVKLGIAANSRDDILQYLGSIPRQSSTIHKLLGINPGSDIPKYNENNKLPYDLIIIDEVSMIDLKLLARLMMAVKPDCKLILLGDHEQLPSVEAGAILSDLCLAFKAEPGSSPESDQRQFELARTLIELTGFEILRLFAFDLSPAVARLYKSYRFEKARGIGALAADINRASLKSNLSEYEKMLNDSDNRPSVKFIRASDCEKYAGDGRLKLNLQQKILKRIIDQSLPLGSAGELKENTDVEKYSFYDYLAEVRDIIGYPVGRNSTGQILNLADDRKKAEILFTKFNRYRVLCTNRGSGLGVENINEAMEERVLRWYGEHPKLKYLKNSTSTWGEHWYPGRPVMINKNNYHLDLFNGDIGITLFFPSEQEVPEMRVLFQMSDGSYRYFSTAELANYELAFAMTVHKSQGSEFDHTVLVLPDYKSTFVTRELLYTGITRAKSFVTVYDSAEGAIEDYVLKRNSRSSNLAYRLKD